MSKSNRQSGLGKALKNKLEKKKASDIGNRNPIFFQETEQNDAEIKKAKLKSIVSQNSLEGFLQIAELSEQDFHANKDIKFKDIREEMRNKKIITTQQKKLYLVEELVDQELLNKLQLPRRPDWHNLTKEQLEKKEADSYLTWRRNLAMVEEKNTQIQITPYEKNIEVWKQLWRVVDRADMIVQIVDGRDVLFYRSEDLESYVKEVNPNKRSLVLVNKSDLVSEEKIKMWNEYLTKMNIDHIFFSAIQQIRLNELQEEEDNQSETTLESHENHTIHKYVNSPHVLSVSELIELMELYSKEFNKEKIEIGLVGYPNVGKSSVINAVFGKKKVAVASLPGKTKHFQTLPLTDSVTLCDCPGLVFPRISSSEAEMILNGLYPVDTLKTFSEAMQILSLRIAKKDIEVLYALHWKEDEIYDGEKIVEKYAMLKGFYTGNGLPNKSIAARHIIKDYITGALKFAKHPPGYNLAEQSKEHHVATEQKSIHETKPEEHLEEINMKKKELEREKELDGEFFANGEVQHEEGYEDAVRGLTEDDMLDMVEGKKVPNMMITKEMRKQIKFAMKRGDKLDDIKKKVFLVSSIVKEKHKTIVKV